MAKVLQLSRPSRRVSNIVRAWWAMRCQKRRRQRSGAVVVLPGVTLALEELQVGDQGSWSPVLNVGIQGELPEGFVVKVWQQLNEAGPFAYRGSTGTSGPFMDWFGMPVGQTATYRARAANADDSVVGPWSADLFIDSP
jgi:hypothetical protein